MFLCNKKSITFFLVHVILFLSWLLTVTADIRFTFSFTICFILHHGHLVHMRNQAEDLTGISPFIIIKTDQFEKMTVYLDSFPCIKGGCVIISDKIGRNNFIIHIIQNLLKSCFGSFLHFLADIFISSFCLQRDIQIHNGYI